MSNVCSTCLPRTDDRRLNRLWWSVAVLAILLPPRHLLARAQQFRVTFTESELEQMSLEGLLHVETDMRRQNELIDKHIASLKVQSAQLGVQRRLAEREYRKLLSGRDWEARQKSLKDKELIDAKLGLSKRQEDIMKVKQHSAILRSEIREYEEKLRELRANKSVADETYSNPSIAQVMQVEAKELGPVPQQILNKTVLPLLYPTVLTGVERAQSLQSQMRASSRHTALASTLIIYACVLMMVYVLYRGYREIAGRLSLARMVFGTDLCCGGFWAVVVVCYALLFEDPLVLLRARLERTLVCTQVVLGGVYCGLLWMRCILLAGSLQGGEAWELFITICVTQDFYQNIWKPSLTDTAMTSGASNYCWYILTHLFLSARRARQMVIGDHRRHRRGGICIGIGIGIGGGGAGAGSSNGGGGGGSSSSKAWLTGTGGVGSSSRAGRGDGATKWSLSSALGPRLAGYARRAGALVQALVISMTPSAAAAAEEDEEDEEGAAMRGVADCESRVLFCADSYYISRAR